MTMIAVLAVSLGLAGPSAADAQVKEDRDASSELRKMLAGFGDDVAVTSNEAGSLAVVSIPLDHPEIASIQARLDQAVRSESGAASELIGLQEPACDDSGSGATHTQSISFSSSAFASETITCLVGHNAGAQAVTGIGSGQFTAVFIQPFSQQISAETQFGICSNSSGCLHFAVVFPGSLRYVERISFTFSTSISLFDAWCL